MSFLPLRPALAVAISIISQYLNINISGCGHLNISISPQSNHSPAKHNPFRKPEETRTLKIGREKNSPVLPTNEFSKIWWNMYFYKKSSTGCLLFLGSPFLIPCFQPFVHQFHKPCEILRMRRSENCKDQSQGLEWRIWIKLADLSSSPILI